MLRVLTVALAFLVVGTAEAGQAEGKAVNPDWVVPERIPEKYWDYMWGYRYKYSESCTVGWHPRTATFMGGPECSHLSNERLMEDAIKSIQYAQARSKAENFFDYYSELEGGSAPEYSLEQAKSDARALWVRTCIDAKAFKPSTFSDISQSFPGIAVLHAARLFKNARDTVSVMGGMVNCYEQARHAVDVYVSDVDIRHR